VTTREQGTVVWFDCVRGYGFIARGAGKDIFVHHRGINGPSGYKRLQKGQRVSFLVRDDPEHGGMQAVGVNLIDEGKNLEVRDGAST
jgi:CspA family cold shock protein